ncbi:ABC transporter substrate-binding protein [Gordonia jinhuaensis]|uniref:Thiamine pyrimidine synthase n=1 Tax=Gordonia jinhuaensis TaxID=1517702 RepID=A0A916TBC7_9ACTN|nr:ABC transporter substrate-binding protein [Gordonia jinhuaensis]GGB38046.1 ABC transporter substrate-binding protein [Gordonia jinhuaensis]
MTSALSRRSFLRNSMIGGAAVGTLGASGLLAACSSGGSSSSATSSTDPKVQLVWEKNVEFAGEYMALENGHYKAAGLGTPQLIAGGGSGTGTETGLSANKVWIGISHPNLTAPVILKGGKLKSVAATFQKSAFCLTSPADKPINTPQDMKGKKIGVSAGDTGPFNSLLAANGMTTSDVTIVGVQYDPTPLKLGQIDALVGYITNDPISLEQQGFPVHTFLFADHGLPLAASTIVVRQDTLDNERDKVKGFIKAEVQGWYDAVLDPDRSVSLAVDKYGKTLNLDREHQAKEMAAQTKLVVTNDTVANGLLTMTDTLVEQNITALGKAGYKITADQLFDLSLIKEVYAENPDLKRDLSSITKA